MGMAKEIQIQLANRCSQSLLITVQNIRHEVKSLGKPQ
jgi:hypothetical protein